MFRNVGKSIKTIAIVFCIVDMISSIITGIVLMAEDDDYIALGLLIIFLGTFLAWVGALFIYGFGQLVQNSDIIANKIDPHTYIRNNPQEISQVPIYYTNNHTYQNTNVAHTQYTPTSTYTPSAQQSPSNSTPPKPQEVPIGGWKCPSCGAAHAHYVGTCGCGQVKP